MEQSVEHLTEDDTQRLALQLNFARALLSQLDAGTTFDSGLDDLARLQTILDSGELKPTDTVELQALGVPFGQVLVNLNPGFDWWMVSDKQGRDACIRYQETDLLLYPLTLISKRFEDSPISVSATTRSPVDQFQNSKVRFEVIAQIESPRLVKERASGLPSSNSNR